MFFSSLKIYLHIAISKYPVNSTVHSAFPAVKPVFSTLLLQDTKGSTKKDSERFSMNAEKSHL